MQPNCLYSTFCVEICLGWQISPVPILNNHFSDFTTKYPGEKIFMLAKFYHLLIVYFGVGDYCLSNSLTSSLFSSQSSSMYWVKSADTVKTAILTVTKCGHSDWLSSNTHDRIKNRVKQSKPKIRQVKRVRDTWKLETVKD